MVDVFSNLFIIASLIVVGTIYFTTFIGIMGKGNTERFPYLGILAVIMAYLVFILINGYVEAEIGIIIWAVLSVLPALAIIISLFVGRRGNYFVDIASLVATLGLGFIPILGAKTPEIDASLSKFISDPSDYSVVIVFASLLFTILLSMATFFIMRNRYFSYSSIDRELANKISEINRQQSTYNAFSSPISKILSDELHVEMNHIKGELKSEIARSFIRTQNGTKISRRGGVDIMVELQKINAMVKNLQSPQRGFTIDDFMRDVKHSLATPLSQIEINCSLLETLHNPDEQSECINKIKSITKVCQCIIASYQEILSVPALDVTQSFPDCVDELLTTVENKTRKKRLLFEKSGLPESISGYSLSVISSMLLPLIQNAIAAAPPESTIEISYQEKDNHILMIKNSCEKAIPTMEQLKTPHYSSKNHHLGVGLSTVRNYLRLLKGGSLDFDVEGDIVVVIVSLKKK